MFNDPQYRTTYISRPYGKWVSYKQNGEEDTPEGIYRGDGKKWNKLVKECQIDDFIANSWYDALKENCSSSQANNNTGIMKTKQIYLL